MENKELVKRQKEVLNKIYEAYQDNDIVAAMAPGEEVGSTDMLVVQHTEVGRDIDEILGNYYFIPAPKELGPFQYFFSTLTLSEEVSDSVQDEMSAAVTIINSMISFGTFFMNLDRTALSYRHVTLLPNDTDESTLSLTVQATILNAISEVSVWADVLDALQYEKITFEQFMEYCVEFRKVVEETGKNAADE